MNRQRTLIAAVFLLLTGGTAGLILHASTHQKLGEPGVLTRSLPGTRNLQVVLPDQVPGYSCQMVATQADIVVRSLPDDTSFGTCVYTTKEGFQSRANVVLMGTDRSSIHKPQVCLTSQGWKIDDSAAKVEKIRMKKPFSYELPVMHLTATCQIQAEGQIKTLRGVYVYWYVDDGKFTAINSQMMLWIARDMLLTGVLDRFSYIAYFSICEPGQEEQTFDRMKSLIADTVPQFQLVPKAGGTTATGS
jgi:hypothetical protein